MTWLVEKLLSPGWKDTVMLRVSHARPALLVALAAGLLAPTSMSAPPPPPVLTITAKSEADLRHAAHQSFSQPVDVTIVSNINVTRQLHFSGTKYTVRIQGNGKVALTFAEPRIADDWFKRSVPHYVMNGLEFNCPIVYIDGLVFKGFDYRGAVIKGNSTQRLLSIRNCVFEGVGRRTFPYREASAASAEDVIYNQCIAAHGLKDGEVRIEDNRFERCALSCWDYSHCIYVSARHVIVSRNRFENCGNPFQLGGGVADGQNDIMHNVATSPAATRDRHGVTHPAYLADVYTTDHTTFMYNTISGEWYKPWTGHAAAPASRGRHLIDMNDYSGMKYRGDWATDTGLKRVYTWSGWRELGYDEHSPAPTYLH